MDVRDLFSYVVSLRWRALDALSRVPGELLERETNTNHHSILHTLIHIMAVEASWIHEDLLREPPLSWNQFRDAYLGETPSLQSVTAGWRLITRDTVAYLCEHPDLRHTIEVPRPGGVRVTITAEQVFLHLAGEEMIHMGEVLASTRQLGIDMPSYYLLAVMDGPQGPWPRFADSWRLA